jgi:hypothetical protein
MAREQGMGNLKADDVRLQKIKEQLRTQEQLNAAQAKGATQQRNVPTTPGAAFLRGTRMEAGAGGASPAEAMTAALNKTAEAARRAQAELAGMKLGDKMSPETAEIVKSSLTGLLNQYKAASDAERAFTSNIQKQEAALRALGKAANDAQIAVKRAQEANKEATQRVAGQSAVADFRAQRAGGAGAPPRPPAPPPPAPPPPPEEEPPRRRGPSDAARRRMAEMNAPVTEEQEQALRAMEQQAKRVVDTLKQFRVDKSSIDAATESLRKTAQQAAVVAAQIKTAGSAKELGAIDTSVAATSLRELREQVRSVITAEEELVKATGKPISDEQKQKLEALTRAHQEAEKAIRMTSRALAAADKAFSSSPGAGPTLGGSTPTPTGRTRSAARERARMAEEAKGTADEAWTQAQSILDSAMSRSSSRRSAKPQEGAYLANIKGAATDLNTEFGRVGNSIRALQEKARVNVQIDVKGTEKVREIEKIISAMDAAKRGETVTLNFKTNAELTEDSILKLDAAAERVMKRGGTIKINADTREAEEKLARTSKSAQLLQGASRGFITGSNIGGGLLIGAGGATLALGTAVAVMALTEAMISGARAGIVYNAQLETAGVAFRHFTGSASLAANAIAELREYAADTPLNAQQVIQAGRSFIALEGGDVAATLEDVDLAGQLAAVSRKGFTDGFQDAQVAIREIMGGQTESFATRFDISRASLNRLKEAGLAGRDLAKAAVQLAGGSKELLQAFEATAEGQYAKLGDELERLNQIAAKPLFDVFARTLKEINTSLESNKAAWSQWSNDVGQAIGDAAQVIILATQSAMLFIDTTTKMLQYVADLAAKRDPKEARAQRQRESEKLFGDDTIITPTGGTARRREYSEEDRARQARAVAAKKERDDAVRTASAEEKALRDIEKQSTANQAKQATITKEYAAQKALLESALHALERVNFADLRKEAGFGIRQAEIDQVTQRAQAPTDLRAEVAGREVILNHAKELIQIDQQRRSIIQGIGDLQISIANQVREAQIRAAQAALQALEEQIRKNQELRRAAIDRLREEQQAAREARETALNGLREQIQAQQEARREAIDAIRERMELEREARAEARDAIAEQTRLRRQGVQDQLDAIREVMDEQARSFEIESRSSDRAHRSRQQSVQDQIERLQRQSDREQQRDSGPTPAERELEALEAGNRERERARSLEDAVRAVSEARSSREWRDARRNLARVREDQGTEKQREELQKKIAAEQEAREQRQQRNQERIAELQRKAQEEDRRYQEQRERREDTERTRREAQEKQIREIEKAEKAQQRAEDDAARAADKAERELQKREAKELKDLEKADREAAKAEAAMIRAQEQANRAADKAAEEQLRAAEKADREATKQEEVQVREEQQRIARMQSEMAEQAAARQLAADRQRLVDMQAISAIELKLLADREKVLRAENVNLAAYAAAAQVKLDDEKTRHDNVKAIRDLKKEIAIIDTKEKLDALAEAEWARLEPLKTQQVVLEANRVIAQATLDTAQKAVDKATEALRILGDAERKLAEQQSKQDDSSKNFLQKDWPFMWKMYEGAKAIANGIARDIVLGIAEYMNVTNLSRIIDFGKLFNDWIIAPIKSVLGIDSPSTVFIGIAMDVINGFIQTMYSYWKIIQDSIITPFNEPIQNFFPTWVEQFTEIGNQSQKKFIDGWNQGSSSPAMTGISMALKAPFNWFVNDFLPIWEDKLWIRGGAAASMWQAGWDATMTGFIDAQFNVMLDKIYDWDENFRYAGRDNALNWQRGFQLAMSRFNPDCPMCPCPETVPTRGKPRDVPELPPHMLPPNEATFIREAGAIVPPDMMIASAASGGGNSTVGNRSTNINITNNINGAGMDMETLAATIVSDTVDAVIDVLNVTEQQSSTPVNRVLPGAL